MSRALASVVVVDSALEESEEPREKAEPERADQRARVVRHRLVGDRLATIEAGSHAESAAARDRHDRIEEEVRGAAARGQVGEADQVSIGGRGTRAAGPMTRR